MRKTRTQIQLNFKPKSNSNSFLKLALTCRFEKDAAGQVKLDSDVAKPTFDIKTTPVLHGKQITTLASFQAPLMASMVTEYSNRVGRELQTRMVVTF